MKYATWRPVYEEILADFGFDRRDDEAARDVLGTLVDLPDLDRFGSWSGTTVAIAGAGPSLEAEINIARAADRVVAASAAGVRLRSHGVIVDLVVTDLDGAPSVAVADTWRGRPVVVAAHGDNIPAIRRFVPHMNRAHVIGTTQAEPVGPVVNFGGFTDGDRAAFLADGLGAGRLCFLGWDIDDPTVTPTKCRKLRWAARLLWWLEQRRGDRFSVLDGLREEIVAEWTPPTERQG